MHRRGGTRSGAVSAPSFQSNFQRNGFYEEEDEEKDPIVSKKPASIQPTSYAFSARKLFSIIPS
jgi:hypothetical protein